MATQLTRNAIDSLINSNNTEETYVFDDKYFELKIGESVRRIEGAGFAKALLRNWIGPKPPTESLKTGLLGTK